MVARPLIFTWAQPTHESSRIAGGKNGLTFSIGDPRFGEGNLATVSPQQRMVGRTMPLWL
jgi:hypothetical protein